MWLRVCKNIGQAGKPVALFYARGWLQNMEPCIERSYFDCFSPSLSDKDPKLESSFIIHTFSYNARQFWNNVLVIEECVLSPSGSAFWGRAVMQFLDARLAQLLCRAAQLRASFWRGEWCRRSFVARIGDDQIVRAEIGFFR